MEKVLLPCQLPGHLRLVQRLGQVEQHLVGGAIQNGDVLRPDVAQIHPVSDHEPLVQELSYPSRHEIGFRLIFGQGHRVLFPFHLTQVHHVQLRPVVGVLRERHAGVQTLFLGVGDLAEGGGHDVLENEVHRLQYAGSRAEVFGQHQHLRVAGLGGVGTGEGVEFL